MLLPAVGESSPFMPYQVCLLSSLCQVKSSQFKSVFVWSLFGYLDHLVNKLHLGSHMAPCSAISPCSRPTFAPCSRSCSPSRAWPSIPPPGLCLFRLHSTTLLDFLGSVLFGCQERPLEGGICKLCYARYARLQWTFITVSEVICLFCC